MIPRATWYLVEKAERANLHLDAFNGHVSAYMKEPYTVITKYDAENRRYIKRFQLKGFDSVLGMRFPHDVRREINAVQPHKGADPPETHPLWQLNKLCNLDKHKLIPIHSSGINLFAPEIPGVKVDHFDQENAIEVSVPEEYKHYLDLHPTLPDPIEIGEWNSDWRLPLSRLSDIHGFITCTVIPRFVAFDLADVHAETLRVYKATPIYRI